MEPYYLNPEDPADLAEALVKAQKDGSVYWMLFFSALFFNKTKSPIPRLRHMNKGQMYHTICDFRTGNMIVRDKALMNKLLSDEFIKALLS